MGVYLLKLNAMRSVDSSGNKLTKLPAFSLVVKKIYVFCYILDFFFPSLLLMLMDNLLFQGTPPHKSTIELLSLFHGAP